MQSLFRGKQEEQYLKGSRKAQQTPFRFLFQKETVFTSFSIPTREHPYFAPECSAVKVHGIAEMHPVLEKPIGNPESPAMVVQASKSLIPELVFYTDISSSLLMLLVKDVLSLTFT